MTIAQVTRARAEFLLFKNLAQSVLPHDHFEISDRFNVVHRLAWMANENRATALNSALPTLEGILNLALP
jgi:hypothetical protein